MVRVDPPEPGLTRRDFLQAGSLPVLGLGLGLPEPRTRMARSAIGRDRDVRCILLFLVGGPSHLDTWDPKPDAPAEVRGPFRPIATNVPGVSISELFPRMATVMDKVALVRSVCHQAGASHDAGHQVMQTGRHGTEGGAPPHVGAVVAKRKGPRGEAPPHVLLPGPIGNTGGNQSHGQDAGDLGPAFDPWTPAAIGRDSPRRSWQSALDLDAEPGPLRDRYGRTPFGRNCLRARRLVERGVRFVTVNMFQTVFHETTWDIHGAAPFSALDGYRDEVGPTFDRAYAALIADLASRGLLATTMVAAFGEFGRTPRINAAGGRDHHPGCGTALFAGGPIRGGRVVGASDAIGAAPTDRPVSPAEIAATLLLGLGLDPGAEPIQELF